MSIIEIKQFVKHKLFHKYSQAGEDKFVLNYFRNKNDGFYVDIGAYHPELISNTALLYKSGWHGLNIDPIKEKIELFEKVRKRDINICAAVGEKGTKKFYKSKIKVDANDACSSFNEEYIKEYNVPYEEIKLDITPLKEILDKHLPKEQKIDFMDIDTETWDLEVLKTNDWSKYRPQLIMIETDYKGASNAINFLLNKGYNKIYQTHINTIFERLSEK